MRVISNPGLRAFTLFTLTLLSACGGEKTDLSCGDSAATTTPIKGPSVGSSGNNSDSPFRALAIHPSDPDTLYVGTEGNALFKSTDGGLNWTWLRAGIFHCEAYPEIYSIAIDASHPSRVYFAANAGPGSVEAAHAATAGVYRSTNAGANWSQLKKGLPTADVNSVLIISGSHVIAGLGAGNSTHSGNTTFYPGGIFTAGFSASAWTESTTPTAASQSIFWQLINRTSGLLGFGGTPTSGGGTGSSGILKSTDGGGSWTTLVNPLAGLAGAHVEASSDLQTIYADLQSGSAAPVFYKSTTGGATWTNPSTVAASATGPIRMIGTSTTTVLVGAGHQILRTTDGFTSVSTVLTAPTHDSTIMMIETAPSDSNVVYATTKGLLVYRSVDAGLSFTLRANLRTLLDSL